MNPTSPTSAMSQGATFMRPGAMAWGQPGQAGQPTVPPPAEPATPVTVEHALAAAAKDPDRVTDLLDELSRGRLWLPLPEVTLDDPGSQDAHQEVLDAVQRAVAAVPDLRFPIDVTFPGESEPDQVDAWISANAEPFYIRS
jgi:hypothetical protein